ncbi:molybdenum ABC transporter ATP-binding protein [Mesorhizobium sp.]|jgi:molybdate transport system ATP-binding protein|uniref:molybdenum ABC transporter ATP-binding protein n=1 Tax=Mesorhizobium sp. TaxID=1871066 RepID=UPI000FE2B98A|nr:molybdenum ABC transporter ATP-binding protein [Mesorhizobium sp.]RWH70833.1 MAG: molybdenum ABC transporter ATP-binding protein [Mesorhizobium sp.]RWL27334.1 MAG: molybdenum ABC transporter ATP-binding protein [Mesorhizobium sp.]RWL31766.1 MAG: molybdenum ABC transporter ATP-binding protein [Mesorhizobium sp.]RWL38590.1 MAG: molybdenum ABC transporter ATP-binding protein [Mesorhizobium sp.]RWL54094.1 MAG: molybdenum ABC transporter ATP-binding protein [Mesorhizobium sp.]
MTLSVDIRHSLGDFALEARFESAGRLTALFGPSGSGKSTLINLIAGLIRPDKGRIAVNGRVLVDTEARVFVPMHKRRIGMVFQDARLFPHMSVAGNLRYGRWFTPSSERYAKMNAVVDLLGIDHLLDRRPARLSGGEKQRVAIGRALLASPKLLLMDEPLASLDEARKAEILPYIERLRDETKIPVVYVSHSVAEVARLASDVVVLSQGKVAASGPTEAIMQRLDLLPAEERGEGGAVLDTKVLRHDEAFGMTVLASPAGEIRVPKLAMAAGAPVRIRIRARDVMIATGRPEGLSALNILAGTITAVRPGIGPTVEIAIDCNGAIVLARITEQSKHTLRLARGQQVFAVIKTVSFDSATTGAGLPVEADG